MVAPALTEEALKETVQVFLRHDCKVRPTAKAMGMSRHTVRTRLKKAEAAGLIPAQHRHPKFDDLYYQTKINQLEGELRQIKKHNLSTSEIREFVYSLSTLPVVEPDWLLEFDGAKKGVNLGVPSCPLTDIHFTETVNPNEIMGLNEFNSDICEARIRAWVERTFDLLFNHLSGEYPGVVLPFLGDFISGLIHEELLATNDMTLLGGIHRLLEILSWVISQFADKFGRVFIPCVPGNHGRMKAGKPMKKGYTFNNFDWHIYCLLEMHFKDDERVKFKISDGQDVNWKVYNWRYRGTHGMQFRGGDGIIGPIGPIFRGDTRKRAQAMDVMRDAKIDIGYDTLVLGHFHSTILLRRLMVCGSIKGFDEFGFEKPFPFEPPQLPLWLNHPTRGITWGTYVQVDDTFRSSEPAEWVSWEAEAVV
jgi:hypothetical protein